MNQKFPFLLFSFLFSVCFSFGQNFDEYFLPKTLRIDFILSGNSETQFLAIDEFSSYRLWAGRKNRLDENILRGNGQVHIFDKANNKLIYTQSFSTLFQEWISTEEAKFTNKSFENVLLVPFPKKEIKLEIVLFDALGKETVNYHQYLNPKDILIRPKQGENIKSKEIFKAKDSENAIHVVFVAEGFQKREMRKFLKVAKLTAEEILSHSPFDKYKDYFNFSVVKTVSKQSGVSIPHQAIWKNSVLNSRFDTFYSERYLTTENVKLLHDLVSDIPYEHIIVLANTEQYGGGGIYNFYSLTTAWNKLFKPVVVHEFGHSFAGLSDEYHYPGDALSDFISIQSEPWEKNITTLVQFSEKWEKLLESNTPIPTPESKKNEFPIGVYELSSHAEIYRSEIDCRMRSNTADKFCVVCQKAIEEVIRFYIK